MTREEMEVRAEELVQDHWNFIFDLLKAHKVPDTDIEIASYHYYEAFKHGYKHCWEDTYSENAGKILMINLCIIMVPPHYNLLWQELQVTFVSPHATGLPL